MSIGLIKNPNIMDLCNSHIENGDKAALIDGMKISKVARQYIEALGIVSMLEKENSLQITEDVIAKARVILHRAVYKNKPYLLHYLLEKEYDPNKFLPENGLTALHYAVKNNTVECLEVLLNNTKNRVNLDSRDNRGKTPMHYAVLSEDMNHTMLLFYSGAKMNAKDNSGNTPLHFAVANANYDVVRFINSTGHAKTDIANNRGITAADLARDFAKDEPVEARSNIASLLSSDDIGWWSDSSSDEEDVQIAPV